MRAFVCFALTGIAFGVGAAAVPTFCDVDRPWTLQAPRTEVRERVPGIYWIGLEKGQVRRAKLGWTK